MPYCEKKRAYNAAWKKANRGRINAKRYEQRAANREAYLAERRAYYAANKDRINSQEIARRSKGREHLNSQAAGYRAADPDKFRARTNAYRAKNPGWTMKRLTKQMGATPPWVNADELKCFYHTAKRVSKCLGIPHQVDHVVPLQSPNVCGLHAAGNLAILPKRLNIRKGNRVWPDMWTAK